MRKTIVAVCVTLFAAMLTGCAAGNLSGGSMLPATRQVHSSEVAGGGPPLVIKIQPNEIAGGGPPQGLRVHHSEVAGGGPPHVKIRPGEVAGGGPVGKNR